MQIFPDGSDEREREFARLHRQNLTWWQQQWKKPIDQGQPPTPDPTLIDFINQTGGTIPIGAVMQMTGVQLLSGKPYIVVQQYNGYGCQNDAMINFQGDVTTNNVGKGIACVGVFPVFVQYQLQDGMPSVGEQWGPRAGGWFLRKNTPGFQIIGAGNAWAMVMPSLPRQYIRGTLLGPLASGGNAALQVMEPVYQIPRQQIVPSGNATGGTFTLSFTPSGGSTVTTAPLAYNCGAQDVEDALNAVLTPSPNYGFVYCGGGPLPGLPITIQFEGALAATSVPTLVVTSSLDGGSVAIDVLNNVSQLQEIAITGATEGSFTLTYSGQPATAALSSTCTAEEVAAALNAVLQNISADAYVTTDGGPFPIAPIAITFQGSLANTTVPLLTVNPSLAGGSVNVTEPTSSGGASWNKSERIITVFSSTNGATGNAGDELSAGWDADMMAWEAIAGGGGGCPKQSAIIDMSVTGTSLTGTLKMNWTINSVTEPISIDVNATQAEIQSAMNGHPQVGSSANCAVSGNLPKNTIRFTFQGTLANTDILGPTLDWSLVGGTNGIGFVTTQQKGASG